MLRRPTLATTSLAMLLACALLAGACSSGGGGGEDSDAGDRSTTTTERDTGDVGDSTDTSAAPTAERTWTEVDCPNDDPNFDPDQQGAICGTVVVPENRDEPEGTQVSLAVMVLPATGDDPEPDPILYLEGGPGGNAFGNAVAFATSSWREDRDIIIYEQRGTGHSTPSLNCEASDAAIEEFLPLETEGEEAEALGDELSEECYEAISAEADLNQYNSVTSAQDVADLRLALGEEFDFEEWNLLGISYGTRLALTVLRDDPEGVRSVIIDSVYPPERDLVIETGVNGQKAFDTFFERCAESPDCDEAYPDLQARWENLVKEVESDPVTIEGESFDGGLSGEVLLDGDSLVGGLFQLLYITDIIGELPGMIVDMEDGDFDYFTGLLLTLAEYNAAGISEGMYTAVQCHEEVPFSTKEQAEAAVADLDPVTARVFDNSSTYEECEEWGIEPAGDIENQPVESDVPTLLMAGGFDPITPISWAESAGEHLSSSFLVVVESAGHGASLTSCGEDVASAFLADPDEDPTQSCADDTEGIRWR